MGAGMVSREALCDQEVSGQAHTKRVSVEQSTQGVGVGDMASTGFCSRQIDEPISRLVARP